MKKEKVFRIIKRVLLVFFTTIFALVLALYLSLLVIMKGPSKAATSEMVTTVLESGNLKFIAHLFLSEEEIKEIVDQTSMGKIEQQQIEELIDIPDEVVGNFDENGIEKVEINGRNFFATLLIVKDPSLVSVASTYPWTEYGQNLDEIVNRSNSIAGINGGLYVADLNKGGSPMGVCVSNGEIQYNKPSEVSGTWMIGFDTNNILRIVCIDGWTANQFEKYVEDENIRDAIAFQDEADDSNNHFVPFIINGIAREIKGAGSGSNPRTCIGQRADGTVLLLVCDGRGANGHLGATAYDLIDIMLEYGAINAANLDGGSSSCMYYDGKYLMTSVTFYYSNSSWRLPTAFVVKKGE